MNTFISCLTVFVVYLLASTELSYLLYGTVGLEGNLPVAIGAVIGYYWRILDWFNWR